MLDEVTVTATVHTRVGGDKTPAVKPIVSTTSVSPSQRPIESPMKLGSWSGSCARPSVQIVRVCIQASWLIVTRPGEKMNS